MKETVLTMQIANLEDLQAALVTLLQTAKFSAGRRLHSDEVHIEGADYVSLVSETLTDGSKVYSVRLTERAPKYAQLVK